MNDKKADKLDSNKKTDVDGKKESELSQTKTNAKSTAKQKSASEKNSGNNVETKRTIKDLKDLAILNTNSKPETSDLATQDEKPSLDSDVENKDSIVKKDILVKKAVIDELNRNYATGRRKEASARTWLKPGNGEIIINKKPLSKYFSRSVLQMIIKQPFVITDRENQYNVHATVSGGGKSGQAGALRHGIARALSLREPDLRTPLKKSGLLTRDSRTVERKKYGLRKARRSFQFSKR